MIQRTNNKHNNKMLT